MANQGGTITVNVTADDIRLGKRVDPFRCMVARAVSRALGGKQVGVAGNSVYLGDDGDAQPLLPAFVRDMIADFDAGRRVEPFSFEMKRPR